MMMMMMMMMMMRMRMRMMMMMMMSDETAALDQPTVPPNMSHVNELRFTSQMQ